MEPEEPKPCLAKKRLFRFMENSPKKRQKLSEVEDYLEKVANTKFDCPLEFWKMQEDKFPRLAKLARRYLAIPATTGSVERVFSIAGAIARARRASMLPELLRALVLYREYLRRQRK